MVMSVLQRGEVARLRRISHYCAAPGYVLERNPQSEEEIFLDLLKTAYRNESAHLMQKYEKGKITTGQLCEAVRERLSPLVESMK